MSAAGQKSEILGEVRERSDAQYVEYIADMILELQGLAQRSGHSALATQLLVAYEAARKAGEAGEDVVQPQSLTIAAPSDVA